ncbi:MAG: 50S ribosomal protein L25 [bacterium]
MKLTVTSRQDKKAKDLRKEGLIPGIVYGKHLATPLTVACKKNDLIKKYKEAGYSTPLTLSGDGIDQLVLIQDIQVDPVTDILIHIDFLAVNKDEKVTTEIPVKMIGESVVEKLGEGKIQLLKDFIEVEAFPQDLPHDVTIDISVIKNINDVIVVGDLKFSDKVEVLDDPEQAIVTVLIMSEEVEEAPVAAVEATPAAGTAAPAAGTTPAAPAKDDKKEQKK